MEIDSSEDESSKKSRALKKLTTDGRLPISIAKLSGSSKGIPPGKDFYFYKNFQEFKNPITESDKQLVNLLRMTGESAGLFGKSMVFPDEKSIELDDEAEYDWLENVNDEIFESFDASVNEFKRLREKEEERGVRITRLDDDSENGFQIVHGKKNKKILGAERNVEDGGVKGAQEVTVAAKMKPKVPYHIPTIPRPQDEYKIIVNNTNQPFEHVWLNRSEDNSKFIHPLEKLSILDFIDNSVSIVELAKPAPIECTPFKLVETVRDLKELASGLSNVDEFAVDLEHNHYRSFQGLTCLIQISTRSEDFVVDTLKLRIHIGPYLREVFKDPAKRKVMHGADRDIIWLQRDFGIYICNMFDTGQASRVLKMERNSLEYLLHHFCGVTANKEYQGADWRLRPIPPEMIRYAREDTHYLLYIYDVMRMGLLSSSPTSGSSDPPIIDVYKRSYDICVQFYEKELLTDTSYLYIYGLQDAGLNAQQLAIVAGLFEWRDAIARTDDESTGYVLPNRTLIEIAKQMPLTTNKLHRLIKSKHPYVEYNLSSVVTIIKQSIQNAAAFEDAVKFLEERRLETARDKNTTTVEESEVLPPENLDVLKTGKDESMNVSTLLGNNTSEQTLVSAEYKDGSTGTSSSTARILTNGPEVSPCHFGNVPRKTDCPIAAEATVQVLKKPSRGFGALLGFSAKRKLDPYKREQEETKLEQIKSAANLSFHTFLGSHEQLQVDAKESSKPLEVSPHKESISTPGVVSNLEDIILLGASNGEEPGNLDSEAVASDQSEQQEITADSALENGDEDNTMSLSDLSSSFRKYVQAMDQARKPKTVEKSRDGEGFLQLKPFDYEAARKQVTFGEGTARDTSKEGDEDLRRRLSNGDKRKSSVTSRSQNDEGSNDLSQGRRRQAFPASGNRSATFR